MGDRVVMPDRGSIARAGEDAEFVEPKLMEVLLHLAIAEGELVERRALLDAHWHPGADCEGALTQVICALRRVLGDDCRHPRFIGTVHRHGYRLLVPVEPLTEDDSRGSGHDRAAPDQPPMVSGSGPAAGESTTLLSELRRRRVIRVATAYAVAGWLIVQVAETTFEPLGVPDWSLTLLVLLVALGFPLAVVLAWAVQLTPDGPVLDMQVAGMPAATHSGKAGGLPLVVAAAVLAAVLVLGYQFMRSTVPSATTYSCPVDADYSEPAGDEQGN
jgi:DNA-binding winged helix-turn-helix (wHTH) protein